MEVTTKVKIYTKDCPRIQISNSVFGLYFTNIDDAKVHLAEMSVEDIFYDIAFHKALENYPPEDTHFRYILLFLNNQLQGLLYFQIKKIDLANSLEGSLQQEKETFKTKVKQKIVKKLNFYTLVNGNMMQTGNYGRYFSKELAKHMTMLRLETCINFVISMLKTDGLQVAAVLLKDFYDHERFSAAELNHTKYEEFSVQPNMVLNIRDHWNSPEDYMADLKSKYKVRTRRTIKKLNGVIKRELSADEILENAEIMHQLYKSIADQAGFNLFILNKKYFYSLKKELGDNFRLMAYFLAEELVGFYTVIYNYQVLDAHFLGYQKDLNRYKHLYHNMLYDMLYEAIEKKYKHLDLSRTAMEIKSSIGAEPLPMYLYLKIVNPILNLFTPKVLHFLTPKTNWTERNPFG